MALIENLLSPWTLVALGGLLVSSYLYQFLVTFAPLNRFPAPFPAQFSNLWLLSVCRRGNRYETVDKLHKKMGKFRANPAQPCLHCRRRGDQCRLWPR